MKAAYARYERERHSAIRAGTWKPRKAPPPTTTPTITDLAWAAGFLEGEGSFGRDRTTQRVRADQLNREPLDRLSAFFGGRVHTRGPLTSAGNLVYRWGVHGQMARDLMVAVYPFMSALKRGQIDAALSEGPRGGDSHRHT